jgi:hypothetical protein
MYGFTITIAGRVLLAKLLASETLAISRVMVGSGFLPEGLNPAELTDLIAPVAQATLTDPIVLGNVASFTVEYRSDMNGGLDHGFWLSEFGVFAIDPDEGEILLYYATLGDRPQYVTEFRTDSVDIRRFPISIVLTSGEVDVILTFPSDSLMTVEELKNYIHYYILPEFVDLSAERIAAHNVDPAAHQDIRNYVMQMESRIRRLEDMVVNDVIGNSFLYTFDSLDGLVVTGVWNQAMQRLEF